LELRDIDKDYVEKQISDFFKYGHKWRVASDEIVTATLDPRGNIYKSSSNLINTRPMLFGFDVLNGDSDKKFNKEFENSEKYGYRIIGTGKPNEYTDGMPKPTEDSKFLDLGTLLNIAGNFRNEETLISLADKISTLKGVNNAGKLKFGEFMENIASSIGNLMDAMREKEPAIDVDNATRPPNVRRTTPSGGIGKWDFWYPDNAGWTSSKYPDSTVPGKNGAPDTTFEKIDSRPATPKRIIPEN